MLARTGSKNHTILRISVTSGGCAGMTYNAEIDTELKAEDMVVRSDKDLTVVSDPDSLRFLDGLTVDYSDDLISSGFRFNNSTNNSSCGCGASFSLSGFPEVSRGGVPCDI